MPNVHLLKCALCFYCSPVDFNGNLSLLGMCSHLFQWTYPQLEAEGLAL